MAVLKMQKIRLTGLLKDKDELLGILQKEGVFQITDQADVAGDLSGIQTIDLQVAKLDFAIKTLKNHETKRSILEGAPQHSVEELKKLEKEVNYKKIITECEEVEEKATEIRNQLTAIDTQETELTAWRNLPGALKNLEGTKTSSVFLGVINLKDEEEFKKELLMKDARLSYEAISKNERAVYFMVICLKEIESDVVRVLQKHKWSEVKLQSSEKTASEALDELHKSRKALEKDQAALDKQLTELGKSSWNLKAIRDYIYWSREHAEAKNISSKTNYSFAITGWMPEVGLKEVTAKLSEVSKGFAIEEIEPEEGESAPVRLRNTSIMKPFESVTNVYGLPLPTEVDPTPFLSIFFILFFGLCLTDSGYGLIIFAIMFSALKFMKLPEGTKKMVTLLMWGGVVTFGLGILFGGYFGLTPEQAPGFLTTETVNAAGQTVLAFKWQLINPMTEPITFLLLAVALGVIQVLFGLMVDGYWKIRQKQYVDALLDSALWIAFLSTIMLWGFSSGGLILGDYSEFFKNALLVEVVLMILTQGRKQKGIFAKIGIGVLSLYEVMSYVSDVLSYSRIMALGLGTGIIGFAMNTIAGIMGELIPYVGFLVSIAVIILGHALNLALSTLGAFIHSARLQFVEFFGKFMEGGGASFKPFKRTCKYIMIRRSEA